MDCPERTGKKKSQRLHVGTQTGSCFYLYDKRLCCDETSMSSMKLSRSTCSPTSGSYKTELEEDIFLPESYCGLFSLNNCLMY